MSGTTFQHNSGNQNQASSVIYPGQFLSDFENRYGRGISLQELVGALPQTQSLFGGTPYGYASPGAAGGGSPPAAGGAPPGGTVSLDQIGRAITGYYPNRPNLAAGLTADVGQWARSHGYDPNALTLDQIRGAGGDRDRGAYTDFLQNILPGMLTPTPETGGPPRFQPQGSVDLSALQIPESIQRLFGAGAAHQYTPYQFQNIPQITAPTAQAQEMNIAPQGFQNYENALFQSAYAPQARELARQGGIADQQLQAELAQSGLASSASGQGQLQQQRADREQQRQQLATEAAYNATAQRFGQEFAQQQFNAQQRQQVALENAGFNLDAQKTNAANVLSGNIAQSENYLKTMGLNEDAAHAMRADFMEMLGITQKELERLDSAQRDNLGLLLNNWLQQGALLGNLGQRSTGVGSTQGGTTHFAV